MIQLHKTPSLLRKIYPNLIWEKESEDEIFLTFDDGPNPDATPWVLELLKEYEAKATFFCVGQNLVKYPDVAHKTVEEGHLLANHTFNHLKGWATRMNEYRENISLCSEELKKLQQPDSLFRPPYGRITKKQIAQLKDDYRIVMWSHLSWDFDSKVNIKRAIKRLKVANPGSIIVFHDSQKSFNNLKKVLPPLLSHWSSLNFKFNTL